MCPKEFVVSLQEQHPYVSASHFVVSSASRLEVVDTKRSHSVPGLLYLRFAVQMIHWIQALVLSCTCNGSKVTNYQSATFGSICSHKAEINRA